MLFFATIYGVASVMVAQPNGDLTDAVKKYEAQYENEYDKDLAERMAKVGIAETLKHNAELDPANVPTKYDLTPPSEADAEAEEQMPKEEEQNADDVTGSTIVDSDPETAPDHDAPTDHELPPVEGEKEPEKPKEHVAPKMEKWEPTVDAEAPVTEAPKEEGPVEQPTDDEKDVEPLPHDDADADAGEHEKHNAPDELAPEKEPDDGASDGLSGATKQPTTEVEEDATTSADLDKALDEMKASAKMMVVLHVMLQPMEQKLKLAMAKMPADGQERAQQIVDHIEALSGLSKKSVGLLSHLTAAKSGTPEERGKALAAMVVGMKEIQDGVKHHLAALKMHPPAARALQGKEAFPENAKPMPFVGEPAPSHKDKMVAMTSRLHNELKRLKEKVAKEVEAGRKDDPMVQMDIQLVNTMEKAIKKSEALIVVAAMSMKKATGNADKVQIKQAIKGQLHQVMDQLKTDMQHLKEKSVMYALVDALKKEARKQAAEKAQEQAVEVAPEGVEDKGPLDPKDLEKHDVDMAKLMKQLEGLKNAMKDGKKHKDSNLRSH